MKIYLIRHGETDWNKEGRLQGQADMALNEEGIRQAKVAAERLSGLFFDRIYCSPLCRALVTAEIIKGDREIPLAEDRRLLEIGFGRYEGRKIAEIEQDTNDPFHSFFMAPEQYAPPETAESFQAVYDRSRQFLRQELFPLEKRCGQVLLVAHGALNRSIVNPLAGIPLERFWELSMENCSVFVLELRNQQLTFLQKETEQYQNLR